MIKDRMQQLVPLTKGKLIGSKLAKPLLSESDSDWDSSLQRKVAEGESLVSNINTTTEDIIKLKNEYNRETDQRKEKYQQRLLRDISNRLDAIVKKNHDEVAHLNTLVKELEEDTKKLSQEKKDSAEARTTQAAHQNLLEKMRDALTRSTEAQENFKTTSKEKIKRQIKVVKRDMTDEEVEDLANHPAEAENILKQELLTGPSVQLSNAVSDIECKYRDIMKLQQNINECLRLMQDLAVLVTYQGEMLNNIELMYDEAKDHVEDAEVALKKAKQHHKESQKRICCIVVLVIMLIAIILVISLLITQVNK